jgi:peptide/nickel transport system permease protein
MSTVTKTTLGPSDVPDTAAGGDPVIGPRRTPGRLALRRFLHNKLAIAGAVLLALVVVLALFAPLIGRHGPNQVDLDALRQGPSGAHWFGTDSSGRDVFSRVVHAGRVSLLVGVSAALMSVAIGTLLGAVAGLVGGAVDAAVMRLADIVLSFPTVIAIVVLAGILGPSVTMLVIAIGATHWPQACRVVRGVALGLRDQDYLHAARAGGAGPWWLVRKHIVPAALPPVAVAATLAVAQAVLLEATLSFLGLGVQPPQASWGNMLTDAQSLTLIESAPWMWLPPGIAIALTVLSVNFVGDGLRDAFDPRQSKGAQR